MKTDPKYMFLHVFFLICPSCPLQKLSIWPKLFFFSILHIFALLNDVCAYILLPCPEEKEEEEEKKRKEKKTKQNKTKKEKKPNM